MGIYLPLRNNSTLLFTALILILVMVSIIVEPKKQAPQLHDVEVTGTSKPLNPSKTRVISKEPASPVVCIRLSNRCQIVKLHSYKDGNLAEL